MNALGKYMWMALTSAILVVGCGGKTAQQRHMERANRFFERERYAEAIVSYLSVLQKDRENTEAIRQLGLAYYHTEDLGRAFPLLREAVNREPERLDLKIKLARLYLAGGAPEDALDLAEDVLDVESSNLDALVIFADACVAPDLIEDGLSMLASAREFHAQQSRYHLALGGLRLRKGDLDAAEEALSEAIRLAPDDPDAYVMRSELHSMKQDREAARADLKKAYELAPPVSLAALRWVAFNRAEGRMNDARKLLAAMIAESPRFVPALYELAAIDAAEQRYDESVAGLKKTLGINPKHLPSLLLQARIGLLQGRVDESEKLLEEVLREFPNSPQAHLEMARVQLRKGNSAKADYELREALRLAPQYVEAALALSELDIRAGRYAAAIGRLLPVARSPSPVRPSALLLVGAAQRMSGAWEDSLKTYGELAGLLPESPEPPFLAGLTYQAAGRPDEAARAFEQALEVAPGYVPALDRLVAMDVEQARLQEALKRVEQQIEKAPGVAGMYYVRASVAVQLENWPLVEESLLMVLQTDPQFSAAYRDLGRLYVRQGRIDEALDKFNAAMGVNPRDVASLMMMGVLHEQEGRIDQALETYERILKIEPRFVGALNNVAYQLALQGKNLDRAVELAQRARELAPLDPAIADTLGLVALKRKDYRWAQGLLEEGTRQLGGEPEVWYRLALARHGLGNEEGAREALARALAIERDFPGRDEARLLQGVLDIPLQKIGSADAQRLEKAREMMPDNPSVLVRLGMLRSQEGNRAEALALNEKALALAPDFLPALLNLTWLHEEQPERAVAYGRKARELAPNSAAVAHALGRAAFLASDYAWSRSLLLEAAGSDRADTEVLFNLAQASLMVSRVDDCRREAEQAKAAAADKSVDSIADFLALLDLYTGETAASDEGRILEAARTRDPQSPLVLLVNARLATGEDADAQYRRLIARYPSWALPARDFAALRVARGLNDPETLTLAQSARERLPDDPVAVRSHALALACSGSVAQAIPLLRRVVQSNATDGIALYWLATSLGKSNAFSEAVETMQRAVKVGLPASLKESATSQLALWESRTAE